MIPIAAYQKKIGSRQRRLTALAFAISLLLTGALLLAACAGAPGEPVDPYARFRPALKDDFQHYLDDLGPAPIYDLTIDVAPDLSGLSGLAVIQVPNTSREQWNDLLLRLYPMLEQYGGYMVVKSVSVDGEAATFVYTTESTALQIDLPSPLQPDEEATVRIAWDLTIPVWSDLTIAYHLFGRSQGMTSLPLFYPSVAVYEDGPAIGTGRWWLETGSEQGDAAFNAASLFVVTATLPAEQVPVTSGTLITSTALSPTRTRYVWVAAPVREFLLHMSPDFEAAQSEAYDTTITSYWLPGDHAAGKDALADAVAALRIYSDRFGEYPYRDMRVAVAPISVYGMEYPQVSLLGVELYGRFRENIETLVAHEVAHQWWYQMVHNDPVNEPWLDEALAEFSTRLYVDSLRGGEEATRYAALRWQIPVESLQNEGRDTAANLPVSRYEDAHQYETIVYGKGSLFFEALYQRLGNRRFNRLMEEYLDTYRYGIVDREELLAFISRQDDPELLNLYNRWIDSPQPPPRSTATPEP